MIPCQISQKPVLLYLNSSFLFYRARFHLFLSVHVPGPPKNLKAVALSPTSVHVSWEPPESPGETIQKYKLFYIEDGKYC